MTPPTWRVWLGLTGAIGLSLYLAGRVDRLQRSAAEAGARLALAKQEALAGEECVPLTAAELLRPVVPADNAKPYYDKASLLLRKLRLSSGWRFFDLNKPGNLATAKADAARAKPVLDLIDQAARRPYFHLGPKALAEPVPDFATASNFKAFAGLVASEAEWEAFGGHPAEALKRLARRAKLCRHLGQEPGLIPHLVSDASEAIANRAVADILQADGRRSGVPEATERALSAIAAPFDLERQAEGENISNLSTLDDAIRETRAPGAEPPTKHSDPEFADVDEVELAVRRAGMSDTWRAVQIEQTRKLVSMFRSAGSDKLELEKKVDAYSRDLAAREGDDYAWSRLSGSEDAWPMAIDAEAIGVTRSRVLAQACAVLAEWNRTGRLPRSLPLGGEASRDPLSKNGLHYRTSLRGFTIYGVGPGGVDHGGRAHGLTRRDHDIVFSFPAGANPS